MIRHLFKLIWNRKRTNVLIMTEIFVSFLVLFAVVALGVYTADNWRRPLGLLDRPRLGRHDRHEADRRRRLRRGAAGNGPAAAAGAGGVPRGRAVGRHHAARRTSSARRTAATSGAAGDIEFGVAEVTDEFKDVLGLRAGRRPLVRPRGRRPDLRSRSSSTRTCARTCSATARPSGRTSPTTGRPDELGGRARRSASSASSRVSRGRRVRRRAQLRVLPQDDGGHGRRHARIATARRGTC